MVNLTGWFYDAPLWASLLLFVGVFVAASWGILLALRPWVRRVATDGPEWDRILGSARVALD